MKERCSRKSSKCKDKTLTDVKHLNDDKHWFLVSFNTLLVSFNTLLIMIMIIDHIYSATCPLPLRGAPDYSTDTVSEFHAKAHRPL